jgi:predicted Zn-dependent peptidase
MNRLLLALIFVITAALPILAADITPANPRNMSFPELRFDIPKAERVLLESGMPVYLLRDPELPIINITAMVHSGSVYETAAKSGLAGMTGLVMRSGGAGDLTAEQVDSELEFMASAVESSIGSDMGTVSLTSLTKNFPKTLRIFSDVLLRPTFENERVEIARRHLVESIRRQNDDPKALAERELGKVIYAGHPLGYVPTFASAAAITRQEMIDFHRRFYRPDNMILAVSGDFDRSTIINELDRFFWRKAES